MLAFLVLLVAALSRFYPYSHHLMGVNITAVGAGLLFFGSRQPRYQAVLAVAVMATTDFLLTRYVYGYPFEVSGYLVTWAWYGAVCLLASGLLRKVSVLLVAAGVIASATSFFVLSNFMVWTGTMYAHNVSGLAMCYWNALPFYRNDLISTGLCSALFFGLPVLVARFATAEGGQQHQGLGA